MDPRQKVPAIDRLLAAEALAPALKRWQRGLVVSLLREQVRACRERIATGRSDSASSDAIVAGVLERLAELEVDRPRAVVNATGVVLHTNLGRAPLSASAVRAVARVAAHYCDLEYDLEKGRRGRRGSHPARWLERLFPGFDALVVNNNAAAVLLALNTLALGREVPISRGELIEIGGSFRIPEILERSGATLVEVGTTNRTHPEDYRRVLGPQTAMILKVWPSNYEVVGFTREVHVPELVALAGEAGVPVVADQGCGRLLERCAAPAGDPSVERLLEQGVDLVCFSGDKMLGGPQAGILVGRREIVAACARNPLARALRPDKMTLAALTATLREWMSGLPETAIPTARMLSVDAGALRRRADALARRLRRRLPAAEIQVVRGTSCVGGGSAPGAGLPTWLVGVGVGGVSETRLLAGLRRHDPPVVARIEDGRVVIDPRTLLDGEAGIVVDALVAATKSGGCA
ncbi:MAG: L-seryl-tRNA(Sec) selenium transferase [Acidobacteriota bacterium]|nr:L-seryl-tRNA(Sec) selenium transferase [Acidobacteriota bacterium]